MSRNPKQAPQKKSGRPQWGGLSSKVLRGGGGNLCLQRRRSRASRRSLIAGRLLWRRTRARIGHQPNIHAAVLGPTGASFIRLDRLILAQPDQINLVGRNALLRSQILDHSIGPALAQIVVVL